MKPSKSVVSHASQVMRLIKAGRVNPVVVQQMLALNRRIERHLRVCPHCRPVTDSLKENEIIPAELACQELVTLAHLQGAFAYKILSPDGRLGPFVKK